MEITSGPRGRREQVRRGSGAAHEVGFPFVSASGLNYSPSKIKFFLTFREEECIIGLDETKENHADMPRGVKGMHGKTQSADQPTVLPLEAEVPLGQRNGPSEFGQGRRSGLPPAGACLRGLD